MVITVLFSYINEDGGKLHFVLLLSLVYIYSWFGSDFFLQSDRAKQILLAAYDGDKDTISSLLPDATAEEINCLDSVGLE